jgi:hypothetical protein
MLGVARGVAEEVRLSDTPLTVQRVNEAFVIVGLHYRMIARVIAVAAKVFENVLSDEGIDTSRMNAME